MSFGFGFRFGFSGEAGFDPSEYRIVDISEVVGSCEYATGGTCVATTTLIANTDGAAGAETFTWTVDAGTITSGQGTSIITVETDADADVTIYVTCEASDTVSTADKNKTIQQVRTEEVVANGVTYNGEVVTHLGVPVTYSPPAIRQLFHNGIPVVHNGIPVIHTQGN